MSRNAIVTSARSVAAARQLLAARRFDAIILDVSLPDGSGMDLLPLTEGDGSHRPVIISYTADEPSRALRGRVDVALIKSRQSVTQLLVTVLAHIDSERSNAAERRLHG
jgi:DNA-binding response OmpR family regulator